MGFNIPNITDIPWTPGVNLSGSSGGAIGTAMEEIVTEEREEKEEEADFQQNLQELWMTEAGYVQDENGLWVAGPEDPLDQLMEDWTISQMGAVYNEETEQWEFTEEEGLPELTPEQLEQFDIMETSAIDLLTTTIGESVGEYWETEQARLAARGVSGPGIDVESTLYQRTTADIAEAQAKAIGAGTTAIAGQKAAGMLDYQMGVGGMDISRAGMTNQAALGGAGWQQYGDFASSQGLGQLYGSGADRALAQVLATQQSRDYRWGNRERLSDYISFSFGG